MSSSGRECRLMKIFYALDVDRSGVITTRELSDGLCSRNVDPAKIQEMLKTLDLNGDGTITLKEYRLAVGLGDESLQTWKELFKSIDIDNSGEITTKELRYLFDGSGGTLVTGTLEEWIHDFDKDKNGRINYQEFITFVTEYLV